MSKTPLVVLSFALVASGAGMDPISFRDLRPLEAIRVQFSSRGCFHNTSYELTFKRGRAYVATISDVTTNDLPGTPEGSKSVVLGDDRVAGLDRLLGYYRRGSRGECTTVDTVTVTRLSGDGAVIGSEEYIDDSCGTYFLDRVTLLPDLRYQHKPEFPRPPELTEF